MQKLKQSNKQAYGSFNSVFWNVNKKKHKGKTFSECRFSLKSAIIKAKGHDRRLWARNGRKKNRIK